MATEIEPGDRCESGINIELGVTYQATFADGEQWFQHQVPGFGWYYLYFSYDDAALAMHERLKVYWHQDCRDPHEKPPKHDTNAPRVNIPEIVDGLGHVATFNTLAPMPFRLGLVGKSGATYRFRVEQAPGGHKAKY